MKFVPQRLGSRGFAVLAAALLFFILAAIRLHNGSHSLRAGLLHHQNNGDAPATTSMADGGGPSTHAPMPPTPERPMLAPGECISELQALRSPRLALSDSVVYSRRCIKPIWGNADPDVVGDETRPLLTQQTTVNLTACSHVEVISCDHLPLHVPYAYPDKQYSHLLFGVASNFQRMKESIAAFAHWLSGSGALLVGVVVDAADADKHGDLATLEQEYKLRDIDAKFIAPQLKRKIGAREDEDDTSVPVEHHHFMLIRDLLALATPKTKWLGILDDDTFFPSLYPVDQELGKYDPSRSWWLGALSDSFESVRTWGLMAYGGAGVFISVPLATQLEPHMEDCIREARVGTGDGILRDCMYGHTRTKLTLVRGLNQLDIHGDVSGFFEGGLHPLSLHHWKSWFHEPVPEMAAATSLCGDCFLQRWRFNNNTLLTNGYSISVYAKGLADIDLDRIEGTWEGAGHDFDFSYGPLRPKLPPDLKKTYRLTHVEVTEKGDFRQLYVLRGNATAGEMDEVVELLWEK